MSFRIIGFIAGKEIILEKENLEKCNFCEMFVTPKDFMWQKTIEQRKRCIELFGEIPKDFAGKIGKKIICKDCIGDLVMLLPFKYNYDD